MKNINISIFLILFLASCDSKPNAEEIKEGFKEYETKYVSSYQTDQRQGVTELGGGWVKEEYAMLESSYDVQSTNSLVSPYLGMQVYIAKELH